MTPVRKLRPTQHVPMTNAQYLRFTQRRPLPRIEPPTDEWIAGQLAHSKGRPYWGDTIRAAGKGQGGDEVDAGYLAAIRLAPRLVGLADGEVPMAVADRLYDAGLVRKVRPAIDNKDHRGLSGSESTSQLKSTEIP